MRDSKTYKIFMVLISLAAAGMNAYRIVQGEYGFLDVFLVVVFLLLAGVYLNQIRKMKKK